MFFIYCNAIWESAVYRLHLFTYCLRQLIFIKILVKGVLGVYSFVCYQSISFLSNHWITTNKVVSSNVDSFSCSFVCLRNCTLYRSIIFKWSFPPTTATHPLTHTHTTPRKSPVAQTIQNCYCPLHISFSLSNGNSLLFYKIRCVLRWHLQPLQLELELMRGHPLRSRLLDKRDRMKQLVISRPFQGEPHTLIIVQFHGDF